MATETSPLFSRASEEFRLIALCCRWPVHAATRAAIHAALQRSIDWPTVLHLAQRHRVGGLVAHALATAGNVPAETLQALSRMKQSTLLSNLKSLRVQVQLAAQFQANGIAFAVLKGTPLAMQAFGDLSLRQSRDIDLLVREADAISVDTVLQQAGYQHVGLSVDLNAAQRELWLRSRKHYEYIGHGVRVEVHWRTTDNSYLAGTPDPLRHCEKVVVAPGAVLPVLARRERLLNLCTHGAGHAWFRMKWIADIAALLNASGEDEQRQLLTVASQYGLERAVLQALYLSHALFELPLHKEVETPSAPMRLLCRIAANALLQEDLIAPSTAADYVPKHLMLSRLLLRSDWRYRIEELRLNMAAPSDWKQVSLSPKLQFLYPLLRAPLWLKRRWFGAR